MLMDHVGRETPLVAVFIAMCTGILAWNSNYIFMGFCLIFLAMLFSLPLMGHMALGMIIGYAAAFCAPGPVVIPDGEYRIQGRVESSGFMRGNFRIVLEDASIDGKQIRGLVILNVYKHVREIGKGCTLKGKASFSGPRILGNPGEFDYSRHLLTQGITLSGRIKDLDGVSISGPHPGKCLKDRLIHHLSRYSRPEAEILNAAVIGDRSGLVYSLQDKFSSLGVTHLIAISGLHMGIVFFLGVFTSFSLMRLAALFGFSYDTPLLAKVSGLFCVILYTWFVGYSPPTTRAAIMVIVVVLSLMLTRKPNLLESLSTAGIIILLWMPYSLYSVSFLLSFSAVLGIIGFYQKGRGLPGWLQAIAVPLVSMAFTSPIIVYLFGFISPVSIPANIIFVPWFSFIIMPLGIAGLALTQISEHLSSLMLTHALDGISFILKGAETAGSLEPVAISDLSWVLVSYLALIVAFFSRSSTLRSILLTFCVIFIIAMPVGLHIIRGGQGLTFDIISVGQGDGMLITKNFSTLLIDGGPAFSGSDAGRSIVAPHLLRRGVNHIDLAIITHAHPDHSGGMPFILNHFPVKEIMTTSETSTNPDFQNVIRIAERKSIPVKNTCLGDVIFLDGTRIEVLNPPGKNGKYSDKLDQNLQSLVVRIGDNTMRGLFMADAAGLGEIRLSRLDQDISADILKIAHHGTKQSCLGMFLERVKPQAAVISLGQNNHYNLPHKSVIQRLEDRHICTYRTDHHGNIRIAREAGHLKFKLGRNDTDKGFNKESARYE